MKSWFFDEFVGEEEDWDEEDVGEELGFGGEGGGAGEAELGGAAAGAEEEIDRESVENDLEPGEDRDGD